MAALDANRRGKLTEDQQIEFRRFLMSRRILFLMLPFVLLVAVTYETGQVGLVPVYAGLSIAIPMALFLATLWIVRATFSPMLADVDAGIVETVTGEVGRGHKGWYEVGGRRVRITLPVAHPLRHAKGKLNVYMLPKSGLVVGFESSNA